MSKSPASESAPVEMSHEEWTAALFAQMVMQQANMAMMLLGKVPHPQTGKTIHDLEGARMFIDQLEMLETKTKGNLGKDEESLLKQSLMSLRLAFVEAAGGSPEPQPAPAPVPAEPAAPPASDEKPAAAADESKKKFTKKY